jgi:hypothetical protein
LSAGAIGADQGDDFTFIDMERDIVDGVDGIVEDVEVIDSQHALFASEIGPDDFRFF